MRNQTKSAKQDSYTNSPMIFFFGSVFSIVSVLTVDVNLNLYILNMFVLFIFSLIIKFTYLPALGLFIFCLSPVAYLSTLGIYQFLNPGNIVLFTYLLKNRNKLGPSVFLNVFLIFPIFLYLSFSSPNVIRSLGWTLTFFLVIAIFSLKLTISSQEIVAFVRSTKLLILILGTLAFLEWSFGWNPIRPFYNDYLIRQVIWSTDRITTTLGHPINNGLIFATLLHILVVSSAHKSVHTNNSFYYALAFFAVVLSGSRAAFISLVFAIIYLMLAKHNVFHSYVNVKKFLKSLPIIIFLSLPIFPLLLIRNNSQEGIKSINYRFKLIEHIRYDLPEIPTFGFGPGLGSTGFVERGFSTILENGVGQLIYGLGFSISLTLMLIAFALLVRNLYRRNPAFVLFFPVIVIFFSTNFINDNFTSISFTGIIAIFYKLELLNVS